MNKKQRADLDIISRIDDEIIDKNTKKRVALLNKKRRPRWIIPSSVAAAIVVCILVPILIFMFAKQVPIYEGMTVSNYKTDSTAENLVPENDRYRFDLLSNTNNGNNGNHYGHDKKPIDDIVEEDTSISLEIPEQQMYYANQGQDIYITVHISNPDSFEILSFTLNGKKYSSYMFEDGSDMENLILKVNVGNEPGIREYTIDAIKYVDGTEIKDVDMRGERTVKVGIYSAGIQPTVQITDEIIGINEISFKVDLADGYKLIERSGGKVFAGVYTEDGIVAYKEIEAGENSVTFDGLDTYTSYRYGVVAYYDALDGNQMDVHTLYEKDFTTQSVVAPNNVQIDKTSISFGLTFSEIFESKNLTSLTLYHGDDKVKDFDVSSDLTTKTFTATELLSNNKYRIVISYENVGATETVEFEITTQAKETPDFTITETEKTQTSFKFDIAITDVDAVGAITKIELIHGEDVTNVENLTTREFTDLLSNNDYTVKVTYTYDLNDGVGNQTLVKELAVKTEEKVEPTFTIKDVTSDMYTVSGSYDQTGADNTLISYTVKLFKGDELVKENTDKKIEFDSLDYYTEYTVKITYNFDVNDGKGVQTKTVEQSIKTTPYIDITSTTILDKKDVYFDGDKATLRINIDNPLAAKVEYVIIDGKNYAANGSSTSKIILVDVADVAALGNAIVQGLVLSIDGNEYTVNNITQMPIDIVIIGKMTITSWEFVDSEFEPIEYATASDKVYLVFSANKLAGNTITKITLTHGESYQHHWNGRHPAPAFELEYGEDDIKILDDGRFYVEFKETEVKGYNFTAVTATYKNDYVDTATSDMEEFYQQPFILLNSSDVRYVSTPEEFMAMEDGYVYELSCDIDFSTVGNWEMRGFKGVLDGKGYAIQNLLLFAGEGSGDPDGDIKNSGIFTYLDGIIQNLNFENFVYTEKNDYGSFYGTGIVGFALRNSIIRNCTVDENSEIVTTRTYYYTGGICGISFGLIENCINYSTIETGGLMCVGGICGANRGTINDCTSYAKITSSADRQGGICGWSEGVIDDCENYTTFIIDFAMSVGGICAANGGVVKDCINHANITASEIHGLMNIAGICGGSSGEIANCTNNGNITVDNSTGSCAGICVSDDGVIVNCTNNGTVTTQ